MMEERIVTEVHLKTMEREKEVVTKSWKTKKSVTKTLKRIVYLIKEGT